MKVNEIIKIINTQIDTIRTKGTITAINNLGGGMYEFTLNDILNFEVEDNIKIQDTPNFNIDEIEIKSIDGNKIQVIYSDANLIISTFGTITDNNPSFFYGEYPELNDQLTKSNFNIAKLDEFILLELPFQTDTSGDDEVIFDLDFNLNFVFGKHENYEWTLAEIIGVQSNMQELARQLFTKLSDYSDANIFTKVNSVNESTFTRFEISDRNLTGITATLNITFKNAFKLC